MPVLNPPIGESFGITVVMPTIDWGRVFESCCRAALAALGPQDEMVVVVDGPAETPPAWLADCGAVLLATGRRSGPAAARNLAAKAACGAILLFVDADVEVHADVVTRVRSHFREDPELAALFGSYDDAPSAPGLVSRFRNLLHHHTHTSKAGLSSSFWAGCGAVRRDRFLSLGGFDGATYRRPCIEDIDFGLRLHDAGGRILLDPSIQGTHHKRWTLALMLQTDVLHRAIPLSRLLLRRRRRQTPPNLDAVAALSAGFILLCPLSLAALAWPGVSHAPLLLAAGAFFALFLLLNRSLLALLWRRGGAPLLLAGAGLHGLHHLVSALSLLWVLATSAATAQWAKGEVTPTTR
jgi:GT2 family glycosyltransferase